MSISTYKVTKKSAHIQVFSFDMCRLNYGLSLYRDFFSALRQWGLFFYEEDGAEEDVGAAGVQAIGPHDDAGEAGAKRATPLRSHLVHVPHHPFKPSVFAFEFLHPV